MRCEGYTRHGGAFTLGPITWVQCKKEAIVNITATQDGKTETFPMCADCWKKGIDNGIEILSVVPIIEQESPTGTNH